MTAPYDDDVCGRRVGGSDVGAYALLSSVNGASGDDQDADVLCRLTRGDEDVRDFLQGAAANGGKCARELRTTTRGRPVQPNEGGGGWDGIRVQKGQRRVYLSTTLSRYTTAAQQQQTANFRTEKFLTAGSRVWKELF